jgi:uncharacterized membrane protein YedE/YeeE
MMGVMDLGWLIETLGDHGAAAAGGIAVGAMFGFFAQRSRFCLRSAVIEFGAGAVGQKMAVWLLVFSAAVTATQLLAEAELFDPWQTHQLSARGSLSGAVIGGLAFGIGMILARGCPARLLVLSANGNLRALLSGLVFAVVGQASLRGVLAPLRDVIAGWVTVDSHERLSLLALLGLDASRGWMLGLLFLALAVWAMRHSGLPARRALYSVITGVAVGVAWWFTYSLAQAAFTIVPIEAISFTGPSANTLMLVLSPGPFWFSFDVGLVPGVVLGSYLSAVTAGELKLEGFRDGQSMRRYIVGAVLMGFGGMLAGGCAVGAGVSGGALFAVTAWATLTCIWISATLTDLLLDRGGRLLSAATPALPPP